MTANLLATFDWLAPCRLKGFFPMLSALELAKCEKLAMAIADCISDQAARNGRGQDHAERDGERNDHWRFLLECERIKNPRSLVFTDRAGNGERTKGLLVYLIGTIGKELKLESTEKEAAPTPCGAEPFACAA